MARGTMKLVDPGTGKMECKECGSVHWANLRTGGHYFRGSWQCIYRADHSQVEEPAESLRSGV
jgi:hypothetical protein